MTRRLLVVGGGISGLAAAWAARQRANRVAGGLDVLVLERGGEVGGKARSERANGWLVECGPAGFLGGRPEMDRLVEGAGMSSDVVTASPSAAHRFIFTRGKIREVKPNPVALVRSGILGVSGAARMLAEPFLPRRTDGADESVWDFARRRLGREAANQLISPMTLGIFAGDARRLSLESAFPRMAALERDHGSLIRGMIARKGKMSSGALSSFKDGMQSFPRALATRGGFTVRCNAAVAGLSRTDTGWLVSVAGDSEPIPADAVILASEPWASAELLRAHSGAAAAALDAIPCPAVAVVGLGFGPEVLATLPRGFGVLIARGEGLRMLGNLWETHIYPSRSPDQHLLIRVMLGGSVDIDAGSLSASELVALARAEISRLYSIDATPVFEHATIWPKAIPQYVIGHRERVAAVERALDALPGLDMTGFGLRGIAFADAASDGVRRGERAIERLVARPAVI
ncbi:MAG: protoporphyrinogen oxidase [Gemmatimonadaceae bacterium]